MRTTVTLEPNVQKLLKDTAHRKGLPFKQLNDALRAGLGQPAGRAPAFKQRVFSLGRCKVDLTKAGVLAAELEDQEIIAKARRGKGQ